MSLTFPVASGRSSTAADADPVAGPTSGRSSVAQLVDGTDHIPVLRPLLPSADALLPYLRRIDAHRVYSNFGPLTIEFGVRLAAFLGLGADQLLPASSGTSALIGSVLAAAGEPTGSRPFAIVPAFTFAATAIAIERCGFKPYFVDVDPKSWMLDPEALENHPMLGRAAIVVPVAPFGRPVPQTGWLRFRERTGIPIVIDAAASFACIRRASRDYVGSIPTVLSFHATKSFGIGEGGCVISTDRPLLERVFRALNFGFLRSRDSAFPSINGKLSEYHAAVGHAALDGWEAKRVALEEVAANYRDAFSQIGFAGCFVGFADIDGHYALYCCETAAEASRLQAGLKMARIGFRQWYDKGLHRHTHFVEAARDELPVTEQLGERLIGLPMAVDLDRAAIERVVGAVQRAVDPRHWMTTQRRTLRSVSAAMIEEVASD